MNVASVADDGLVRNTPQADATKVSCCCRRISVLNRVPLGPLSFDKTGKVYDVRVVNNCCSRTRSDWVRTAFCVLMPLAFITADAFSYTYRALRVLFCCDIILK